jgi:hypothetical protein
MMPEQHRQHAGHAENERKPEEIPLLPEPIDIYLPKQFHEIRLLLNFFPAPC